MVSSPEGGAGPAGPAFLGRGFLEDPYLWAGLGALAFGIALALFLRSLRAGRGKDERRAARLSAWSLTLLSLGILSTVALAIFPPKAAFLPLPLLLSGLALFLLGLGSGFFPRAFGLPCLGLLLGAAILLAVALDGWTGLRQPQALLRLVPFSVEGNSFRGELELSSQRGPARLERLEGPFTELSLVVERLELSGPLALLAGPSFYRVEGLVGPRGEAFGEGGFPPAFTILELLLPLGEGGAAEAKLPFALRRRETSAALALQPLAPILYSFEADPSGALVLRAEAPLFLGED